MNTTDTFKNRRSTIGNTYSRTLFVIPSGSEAKRSHSVNYRFKSASDFSYLCGLHVADALLIILGEQTYLLSEKNEDKVWGEKSALTGDDVLLSRDIVFNSLNHLNDIIRDHIHEFDRIAVSFNRDQLTETSLLSAISYDRKLRGRKRDPLVICDSRTLVGTARLVKSSVEILNLKEAGARSSKVHTRLMQQALIGKTERQICNIIEAGFLMEDMQWTAYETIVGSGHRSTLLHARATDRVVQDSDLVLIDAGGEWKGYCSDITRVMPAGRKFSVEQKHIYQVVLNAQTAALAAVKPGNSLQEIHYLAKEVLIEGLCRLGLPDTLVRPKMGELMPHSTSHWMGLDVHDPSPYTDDSGELIRLGSGMCFTVEPGLYFSGSEPFKKYNGIGVRIEDDVIVTDHGCDHLSSVPKEVEEIEQLRSQAV
jgi:Xaa-Pro aminopeptidase